MLALRFLLFPFSWLFNLATRVRNHLYNTGHKKSFRFEVPVIGVGNLNVGGSGKTPMIEYLIRLLSDRHHLATLSRGYGRRTRGLRFVSEEDHPETAGDEPCVYFRKYRPQVQVVVAEDRALAIPEILHHNEAIDCILLDDAFQHRSVQPHLNILLTRYDRPFYTDYVMPVGYLREARSGAARADVIVVTKCRRDISQDEMGAIRKKIAVYAGDRPVFFSFIAYGRPVAFGNREVESIRRVVLLTSVANPKPFVDYAASRFQVIKHLSFTDHFPYTIKKIRWLAGLIARYGDDVVLMTTEKDSARLAPLIERTGLTAPWYFIPIEMCFCENGTEFDGMVNRAVEFVFGAPQTQ